MSKRGHHKARRELLAKLNDLKRELCCVSCGEPGPIGLDFHHKDPDKKRFSIGNAGGWPAGLDWPELLNELNRCLPLCKRCHCWAHHLIRRGVVKRRAVQNPRASHV